MPEISWLVKQDFQTTNLRGVTELHHLRNRICTQKREQLITMTEENKHSSKRWRLSIGITCLLLILLAGSSIFLIANGESSKGHAASTPIAHTTANPTKHTASAQTSTPTLALTPSPSQT